MLMDVVKDEAFTMMKADRAEQGDRFNLKKPFGDDFDVRYDTVVNHDAYDFLRVTVEVPRGQNTEVIILLNGREVGKAEAIRNNRKRILGWKAFRYRKPNDNSSPIALGETPFKELGKAAAAIISDLIS